MDLLHSVRKRILMVLHDRNTRLSSGHNVLYLLRFICVQRTVISFDYGITNRALVLTTNRRDKVIVER